MARRRAYIRVWGIVQGVGFRYFTRGVASSLGLTGWVRNLPDGSVEAIAEGDEEDIKHLISRMRQGPSLARVDNIEVEWSDYKGEFTDFGYRF